MIKEDISLISQNKTKKDLKFIISSERLQQAKVMVIKQDVYQIIPISKNNKDAGPKALQKINFTGNLNRKESAIMFLIIEKARLNKLKKEIKNGNEATLNLSSNLIRISNGETTFSHKLN